ncbi:MULTISPECIES: hypothetical protein [unclassified Mycolicibacterium]|uniref:hypothetical protein n=1 Tax=unclassified Mycolicibacterium TaxID=2636767 RepID=UPI0012DBFFB0|nr:MULTISPECIES: hypothetical protein [unclassified Mycolicibacterium]MUL83194.1 hypothetical protein [Mycolicibacterium sp. CBMA 329]MUL89529.1 hypothetical protein [Mycolicibacterium sp. CBMA 331]MUM02715.1 hypothetical protein [Mycolicibacterium sp. CBMA 334]MUM27361.1 hypothetical protein [Mycolicibacterium sp. CBMA 295]MUM39045.1 hypothetical protein [Mycolicibacterium sp. CBMA 247]
MTVARIDSAAPLRGTAVGMLTAALAVAAHGVAGGTLPGGAVVAQLVVLAVTLGTVAATVTGANRATVLWALLGTGQLLAHVLLATAGHSHGARPGLVMFGAHLTAVSLGAGLIACGARLCAAVSRVVRAVVRAGRTVPVPPACVMACGTDQPLQSALFLAASVSHRGPPVGVAA